MNPSDQQFVIKIEQKRVGENLEFWALTKEQC